MLMLILYESTRKLVGGIVVAKKLTKRQTNTLRRHARHHTKKHMKFMRAQMRKGKTFTQAHRLAMKKVGR
jgi:repressor of nif and glnA expression